MKTTWPFVLGLLLLPPPAVVQAQIYQTLEATNAFAFGISGSNIVGSYRDGEAFFFNGGTYTPLSDPNYSFTIATGISGSSIVGWCTDGADAHGFLYSNGEFTILDHPNAGAVENPTLIPPGGYSYLLGSYQFDGWGGTFPSGISGGNIVGWYVDANGYAHGFLYNGSAYTTLDDPHGVGSTYAQGINGGNIVGWYVDANGDTHGFLYNGSTYTTLDDLNGVGSTYAQGISGGNIVGYYTKPAPVGNYGYGFLYNNGKYTTLADPNGAGATSVQGMSGNTIVGWYNNSRVYYGFTYTTPGSAKYTLTVSASPAGGGKVSGGGTFASGSSQTVTAKANSGYTFVRWTENGSVVSSSTSYTLTLTGNLTLVAVFLANPFIPEQGTFSGLFLDTNDVTQASSGFFTLALTKSGAFTGKITTSGGTYSLPATAPFGAGGQVQFTVPTKQGTLTFNLQLDLSDPSSQQITGTVSDGAWTAGLTADRATFSATTNRAVNYEGLYTLAMAGSEDAVTSPGGFGCGTLSISPAGMITVKGNLADGTAMSQSVSVSKDGRWPFYAAYPAPLAGNGGAVLGWLTFSNAPASALGGTLHWFRPAGGTTAMYQGGFTNLAVPVIGSPYRSTEKPPLALTTAQVTLDGGDLPFTLTNQVTLESSGTIIVSPPNTNKLALTINKTTGAITGSFANPSNPKQSIKINGILFQNQTNAAGYFLGTNQSGAFLLEKP